MKKRQMSLTLFLLASIFLISATGFSMEEKTNSTPTAVTEDHQGPKTNLSTRAIAKQVMPLYSASTKEAGAEGTAKFKIIVMPDGHLKKEAIEIAQTSGYQDLDQAAYDALVEWQFTPLSPDVLQENQTGFVSFNFSAKSDVQYTVEDNEGPVMVGLKVKPIKVEPDHKIDDSAEVWHKVCNEKEIYDLCDQYLVKQFGAEWAKCFKPYHPTGGIKPGPYVRVFYSFSGPANIKGLTYNVKSSPNEWFTGIGPMFDFYYRGDGTDCFGDLKFWFGTFFIPPYDGSKLLTAEAAEKIAKQKGYDVHFERMEVVPCREVSGMFFLSAPAYLDTVDMDNILVNAIDGSLIRTQKAIPGLR